MRPKIIPELKSLLPELTDQEYNGLLNSIRDEGLKHSIELGKSNTLSLYVGFVSSFRHM